MASKSCALLVVLLCFQNAFSTDTSPVFLWSNTNAFSGKNLQEINSLSAMDVNNALQKKAGSLSQYINANAASPEIVVIFVESKLSTVHVPLLAHAYQSNSNGGAFSNLKNFLETSASSLVIPYVSSSYVATKIVNEFDATVYVLGTESSIDRHAKPVTLEEIKSGKWNALSNGAVDVLLVEFEATPIEHLYDDAAVHDKYAADDAKMAEVIAAVQDVSYVAVFASDAVSSGVSYDDVVAQRKATPSVEWFERQYAQTDDDSDTYWPDGVIEGLVVMTPFLGILFLGICCTLQLQSDLKFDAEKTILRRQ